MSETEPKPRFPHARHAANILLKVIVALFVVPIVVSVVFSGHRISAPGWAVARIEERLQTLAAPADISLGGAAVVISGLAPPELHLTDLRVADDSGRPLAELPDVEVSLRLGEALSGGAAIRWLELHSAELSLVRAPNGQLDFALGVETATLEGNQSPAQLIQEINAALSIPFLAGVERIAVDGLSLHYIDVRAKRSWQVRDGLLVIEQRTDDVAAQLFFSLTSDRGVPSEMAMTFGLDKVTGAARMSANFSNFPSDDIASQSPALTFLSVLDAPISGAVRTGLQEDGSLAPLSAALEFGEGALRPVAEAEPIRFQEARSYFTFDPATNRIALDSVAVKSAALELVADGQAFLKDFEAGWPTSLVTQMQMTNVSVNPNNMLDNPAQFNSGYFDFKLSLDPFTVQFGQAVLIDPTGEAFRSTGRIRADQDGWKVDADFEMAQITPDRLLALWPGELIPNTRDWISRNILGGQFFGLSGAMRLASDSPPRISVSHEFSEAEVRFLPTFPVAVGGAGYLSISGNSLNIVLNAGQVTAPQGGDVDVAGTIFSISDITIMPAVADITLHTDSTVQAALSILDLEPLHVMAKAGQPVDLAEGRAVVVAEISTPLKKKTPTSEVNYSARGRLLNVRSDRIVKNRVLTADTLDLAADRAGISISGTAAVDGVPVRGVWSQVFGPEHRGKSRVDGSIELSQRFLKTFGIGLSEDMVSGSGWGDFALELVKDQPPDFRLSSDLNRIRLRIPAIGWSLGENDTGLLEVEGKLGTEPVIDRVHLSGGGLQATGTVAVEPGGGLKAATFDQVQIGRWFDGPVTLTGRGQGVPPAVSVTGGRLDLRGSPLTRGRTRGGDSGPIDLALNRVQVSKSIALSNVRGRLTPSGGLSGDLRGTVVGGAPIRVTLAPGRNGTAIRVLSDNAGSVLRGAGIFQRSNGGTLDIVLSPRGDPGDYDGRLAIQNTRVQDAPALASLLSAVSIVGILEQMDGAGLMFSDVQSDFRLTPNAVQVKNGSAIGPSLGISLAGVYDLKANQMDMQGVISPIYILNGIGAIFTRRGEGLFGFNYRLVGDAADPKIQVNPLSILTPGMFREIFRRPPPEISN